MVTADDAVHGKSIGTDSNGFSTFGSNGCKHEGEHPVTGSMSRGVAPRLGQVLVFLRSDRRLAIEGKGTHALEVVLGHLVGTDNIVDGTSGQLDNLRRLVANLNTHHIVIDAQLLLTHQFSVLVPHGIAVLPLGLAPLVVPPVVVELTLRSLRINGGIVQEVQRIGTRFVGKERVGELCPNMICTAGKQQDGKHSE